VTPPGKRQFAAKVGPPSRRTLRLSALALLVAFASIGLTDVGARARASETPELAATGTVLTSSGALFRDDDREEIRRTLRRNESGTYIGEILRARDSALARWPDRKGQPLRVWIQRTSDVDDWRERFVFEVHNAFVAWDTLTLPLRFQIVGDSATAHVHVNFIDRFNEPISGRTKWARDENHWITDASIMLAVHHRTGEILEDDAMHAMALHEIGHLLGLDHTLDGSSVMAPKVRVRSLSVADRETARLLYKLPAGSIR
jgi:hypothetical protein